LHPTRQFYYTTAKQVKRQKVKGKSQAEAAFTEKESVKVVSASLLPFYFYLLPSFLLDSELLCTALINSS
jgi:hypothetical protein